MKKPAVVAVAGGVLVLGLTVLERLEVALAAMHRAGDASGGVGRLAAPPSLWSPKTAQELIRSWRDWDADRHAEQLAGQVVGPQRVADWYAVVDTVLVTVPLTVLLVALALQTRWLIDSWLATHVTDEATPHDPDHVRVHALRRAAWLAFAAALVYGVFDVIENLLVIGVLRTGPPAALVRVLGLVSLLKIVAVAAAVLPLVGVMAARTGPMSPAHNVAVWLRRLARDAIRLRAPAVAALSVTTVFLLLRGDVGLQLDDVVMRWIEQPGVAVAAGLTALGTGWLMVLSGQSCLAASVEPPTPSNRPLSHAGLALTAVLGAASLTGGALLAFRSGHGFGYPLIVAGAALLSFALLSWPVRHVQPRPFLPDPEWAAAPTPTWLVSALATVPIFALALVAVRAATTLTVTRETGGWWLIAGAVLLAAMAGVLMWVAGRYPGWPGRPATRRAVWTAVTAVVLLLSLYAMAFPQSAGAHLGAVALLFLLAAGFVLALTGLHILGDTLAPRGALALLGLRRTPMITLLVIWFAATPFIDRASHYHDVRLGPALSGDYQPVRLDEAFTTWLAGQHGPTVGGKQHVPMLFIATAGGGIRSAYWTALVLDCLFATQPAVSACAHDPLVRGAVFAASGISGGSLGLAMDQAAQGTDARAIDALDHDFLSPDVAAMAFRDLPNALLRLQPRGRDRAAVMEQSWENAVPTLHNGLFAAARTEDGKPRLPLLLFNSATVDDGCRLNGSALSQHERRDPTGASGMESVGPKLPTGSEGCLSLIPFEPGRDNVNMPTDPRALGGSKDLYDLVCQSEPAPADPAAPDVAQPVRHDIPISAAVHLSARFPYISPSGGLTACSWPQRRTIALDGGLLETSAVSPITELWTRLAGHVHDINDSPTSGYCIEPRLIMLDNGYAPAAAATDTNRPREIVAPAAGLATFTATRGARAEQAAALAFDHIFATNACRTADGIETPQPVLSRIAHLVPSARPGPQAPLGWSLSQFARRDLRAQLDAPANMCQIALIRSWFHAATPPGAARCITGFAIKAPTGAGTDAIQMVTPSDVAGRIPQPGVAISVATSAALTFASTTTDAAGRFTIMIRSGQSAELTVTWGSAAFKVPVPAGTYPVETGANFLISGDGSGAVAT